MSDTFKICCPSCQAEYELPASLHESLKGKSVSCAGCAAPWIPLPASGLLARLRRQPRKSPIDLTPYLKTASDLYTLPDLDSPSEATSQRSAEGPTEPARGAVPASAATSLQVSPTGRTSS